MLRKVLRHIQRQPRELREHYALMGAVAVTGCITLIWAGYVVAFPDAATYTAALGNNQPPATNADSVPRSAPLGGFWEQMKEQITAWQAVGEEIQATASSTTSGSELPANTVATSSAHDITITHESAVVATSSGAITSTTAATATSTQP